MRRPMPLADQTQLLKVQFPLAGMRLPDGETESFFDISTFYWMKMFFFYRISYFARKKRKRNTQSEIVMQEPFILRRSCDFWERTVVNASSVATLGSSESWTNAETNESLSPECRLVRPNCATWRADCIAYELCQCFFFFVFFNKKNIYILYKISDKSLV